VETNPIEVSSELLGYFKGIGHPKMKILSFTLPYVVPNLLEVFFFFFLL